MRTKLEMIVGYLAGRQGESAESIRRELRDPASEASRWLEAMRSRSRGLGDTGLAEMQGPGLPSLIRDGTAARRPAGRRWLTAFLGGSAAAAALIGLAVAWRAKDERLLRLEMVLGQQEARWEARFNHLDAILVRREPERPSGIPVLKEPTPREQRSAAPAERPPDLALARIEARLSELGQRLDEATPRQSQGNPMLDQLRRDVERLGQEAEARARVSKQEIRSLNLALQQVLQILTRLDFTPRGAEPMQIPVPVPVLPRGYGTEPGQGTGILPGSGHDQETGQDPARIDPGQDGRGRGPHGFPNGHVNPRLQRPGGPR
jgi:hypothetical protein